MLRDDPDAGLTFHMYTQHCGCAISNVCMPAEPLLHVGVHLKSIVGIIHRYIDLGLPAELTVLWEPRKLTHACVHSHLDCLPYP